MADIVTPNNEALYRKQFAAVSGHSMECIEETVEMMGKVMAGVCGKIGAPVNEVIDKVGVEEFEKHLNAILDSKDCACKK